MWIKECKNTTDKLRGLRHNMFIVYIVTAALQKKKAATHQFKLHDAHTVPQDVGGRPQQLCEGIQSVVFEGRTSDLETTAADESTEQQHECLHVFL